MHQSTFPTRSTLALAATLALVGCKSLERDLEDLCRAATEVERRPRLGASAKVALATAQALEGARSDTFVAIVRACFGADPDTRYKLLQTAASDQGVRGWSCPALERLYSLKETLSIRGSQIVLNGHVAASISQQADPAIGCDQRIEALADMLQPLASSKPQGALHVDPEETSPYCLIIRVLHTAWSVGFKRVLVGRLLGRAVKTKQSEELDVRARLSLAVGAPGIILAGSGGRLPGKNREPWTFGCLRELVHGRCPIEDKRGGSYDYRYLREQLEQVKKTYPDEERIAVTMNDAAPYHVLRRLVDVVSSVRTKQGTSDRPHFYISLGTVDQINRWLDFKAIGRQGGAITPALRSPSLMLNAPPEALGLPPGLGAAKP